MNSTYHKWIDLEIVNSYFNDGGFKYLTLLPFHNTSRSLTNYGIMVSQQENIISYYVATDSPQNTNLQNELTNLGNLYFQVINNDSLFFNYTDVPFLNDTELFYFENGINPTNSSLVQQGNNVSNADVVTRRSVSFNVTLPEGSSTLEVKTKSGETMYSETISGVSNYLLKLPSLDEGLYQLWINGSLSETFFLNLQELSGNCVGVFCLNVQKLLANNPAQSQLTLNFNARSAFLEYQIVVPKKRKIEVQNLTVLGSDGNEYSGPQEKQIIGGQTAQVFTSKYALKLQANLTTAPQLKMTYANDFSNRYKQLNRDLPNPNVEELRKYKANTGSGSYLLSTIIHV
ncbi:MAG: hypothetical protein CL840_05030 [Crocinitomicaceae bacterium]|nr:hypothetical protein [Crocinitomicaceae bacterium]|tara:strand:+ start:3157 stop:4188 length:1032 start_codon:yes stop_codon:yes gene_type:complete